eukprot:4967843-Pleurochrysis_carterae.AAC.1
MCRVLARCACAGDICLSRSSSRLAAASASAGSCAARNLSPISSISAPAALELSPSSAEIALSCCLKMNSRCDLDSSPATCASILCARRSTSSCRPTIAVSN